MVVVRWMGGRGGTAVHARGWLQREKTTTVMGKGNHLHDGMNAGRFRLYQTQPASAASACHMQFSSLRFAQKHLLKLCGLQQDGNCT